jgi:murein L,D-transpeptidase YafK
VTGWFTSFYIPTRRDDLIRYWNWLPKGRRNEVLTAGLEKMMALDKEYLMEHLTDREASLKAEMVQIEKLKAEAKRKEEAEAQRYKTTFDYDRFQRIFCNKLRNFPEEALADLRKAVAMKCLTLKQAKELLPTFKED